MAQINVAIQLLPIFLEQDFLSCPMVAAEDPTSDCLVHDDVQGKGNQRSFAKLEEKESLFRFFVCLFFFFLRRLVKRLPYKQNLSP